MGLISSIIISFIITFGPMGLYFYFCYKITKKSNPKK